MPRRIWGRIWGVGINDVPGAWKTPLYQVWKSMLRRCYSQKEKLRLPTYIGCSVCEDWKLLSNFVNWAEPLYHPGLYLDKDIISPGNKVYSPETCCFVSRTLNQLLTDSAATRGPYPIGVSKRYKKFQAHISIDGHNKHLGYFDRLQDAHNCYVQVKTKHIKQIADQQTDRRVKNGLYLHIERLHNATNKIDK